MLPKLLISLTVLLIVSTVGAFSLTLFGLKFWTSFILCIILQIILHNAITSIFNTVIALKNKKLENERIKEFTYQGLEVTCPCNKQHKDFVPIRLNTPNMYRCGECDKSISVFINAETALQTEPITNTDVTAAIAPLLTKSQDGDSR